ncbi:radical SAM/SPASM domain-containing protein [Chondromyces crocatus]|nr:radical SAM/SPASM domain-containing protein [Chondromyces crocatus]
MSAEDAIAAVRAAASRSPVVYLGTEAFAALDLLPSLVTTAAEEGALPILMTCGALSEPLEVLEPALSALSTRGPYAVLWTLDVSHHARLDMREIKRLLRMVDRVSNAMLQVLFVLPDGAVLPSALLEAGLINRGCMLSTRRGESLSSYMRGCAGALLDLPQDASTSNAIREPTGQRTEESPSHPLSFRSLVFETTYFCNARCDHCYTSCGPDASRERLSVDDVRRVIDEATQLPNLAKNCHFAGGEATIYWHELMQMLAHADARGFSNAITTNGFWAGTLDRALRKVGELASVGVRTIELSADAMHQDYIAPGVVTNMIRAGKQLGVQIVLRVCTTRRQNAGHVVTHLAPEEQCGVTVATMPAAAIGRAALIPENDLWRKPGLPEGSCAHALNVVVAPDGRVYPCCNGGELCPSLSLGSIHEGSLQDMMSSLRPNFMLRTLVHAGPAHFASFLREAGLGAKLRDRYGSFCELCTQIFTDPELTQAVQQEVQRRAFAALLSSTAAPKGPC